MSLAGPWGEGVCIVCHYAIDLSEEGKLVRHRNGCPGSGSFPFDLGGRKEIEGLAFSSEPVTGECPGCGRKTGITTGGLPPERWRWSYHRIPASTAPVGPHIADCPRSGTPVTHQPPSFDFPEEF